MVNLACRLARRLLHHLVATTGCTDPASVLDVVINTLREAYGTPRLQWSAYHASLAQVCRGCPTHDARTLAISGSSES